MMLGGQEGQEDLGGTGERVAMLTVHCVRFPNTKENITFKKVLK